MIGYAGTEVFPKDLLRDLDRATILVARLPETDEKGRPIRCHEVVRAIRPLLPSLGYWSLVDGHYRTVNHTWLQGPAPCGHVLDLYSIGRYPTVQLVAAGFLFHRDLFREGPRRHDIRHRVVKSLWQAARGVGRSP